MRRTTRLAIAVAAGVTAVVVPAAPALAVVDSYSEAEVLDTTQNQVQNQPQTQGEAQAETQVVPNSVNTTPAATPSTLPFTGGEIATAGVLGASALALGASLVVMGRRKHSMT